VFRITRSRLSMMLIVSVWPLAVATPVLANVRFYSLVQQTCQAYRVPVTMEQMELEGLDSENPTFSLMLQSRRNNFEEVMLVGYIAAGQAIHRTGIDVKTINIVVTIPTMDNMILFTAAPIDDVEQLRVGELSSSDFLRQLQWTK
jgi:hypothetical protein